MTSLYRSDDEKVLAGVCAGAAHRFNLNLTGLRWAAALSTFFLYGIPALAYVIFWTILKERSTKNVVDV